MPETYVDPAIFPLAKLQRAKHPNGRGVGVEKELKEKHHTNKVTTWHIVECNGESLKNQTWAASRIELTDGSVLETTWSLIDPTNLIFKLDAIRN